MFLYQCACIVVALYISVVICVYLVGDLGVLVAEAWSRPGWM